MPAKVPRKMLRTLAYCGLLLRKAADFLQDPHETEIG